MSSAAQSLRSSHQDLVDAVAAGLRLESGSLAVLLVSTWNQAEIQARIGFEASESLSVALGETLSDALRGRGSVHKLGEGSYAVLANAVKNRGHAMLAAEKIWRTMIEAYGARDLPVRPEVCVGVALFPAHANDAEQLIRQAQLAGAGARSRRERILVYDELGAEQLLGQWDLEAQFADALRAGEIEMHYQPKLRIADRIPTGAEALMRWRKDGVSVATPDVFMPMSETGGLLQPTTAYALNTALRQAAQWPGGNAALGVAVNVPPAMVHDREFVDMVRGALAAWSVASERLTVEVTESALIADPQHANATLSRLRDLGVRVSIDDFGTGYSSLSYFRNLSADELKIDKSFVLALLQDQASVRIVRTIIGLAQQFDLAVVAEGVESEATLKALGELGCKYAQGYLFAPALEQREFIEWLSQTRATQAS